MLKKFLATVSVAGLIAGAAHAVELENLIAVTAGGDVDEQYPLAAELDYDGGAVAGDVQVGFGPSAGAFPTGNVLMFVRVTGATFDGALDGSEVSGTATSVISNGGANGGSEVTFLISGADGCAVASGTGAGTSSCDVTLPLELTGSDVTVAIGFETDAGADVDNTNRTLRVTAPVVDIAPAFMIEVLADTTASTADLNATTGPFTDFAGASDAILGTFEVAPNAVEYDTNTLTVSTDLLATFVSALDVDAVDLLLEGTMDAFDPANGGDVLFDGFSADDVDATTDEAAYDATALFDTGALDVEVVPDLDTPMARSKYDLTVTVTPAAASPLVSGTTSTTAVQPITRNGTQITFPWTQTASQGAASGASSVYRLGNLDTAAAGAVFVEVKNASEAGYTNPGITQIAPSIAANGELVVNSTSLEAAVGNYGRGDIEFTIEADPDTLTGRQFVVRNGVIQQVIGGNIDQDINN